jgi:two-component system sensor histidine kinase EvgS
LTAQEKSYLKKHRVIKVQNESDYPPFNYTVNGAPAGYSIDYINLIAKNLGIKVEFTQGKRWHEYLQMFKDKKLDAMINFMGTEDQLGFASFTTPYAELTFSAITRRGESYIAQSIKSIAVKRIVVVEGYASSQLIIKEFPNAEIVSVKNVQAALKALAGNQADVFFNNDAVTRYYIEKHFSTGFELIPLPDALKIPTIALQIGSLNDNATLTTVLQKVMDQISEYEMISLRKKWHQYPPNPFYCQQYRPGIYH